MPREILLMDVSEEDTSIPWWNVNRARLNEVIRAFNQWQIEGRGSHQGEVVAAMINRCEAYGQKNEFSAWQFYELQTMREHVSEYSGADTKITLLYESPTDTEIPWWNENRMRLNEVISYFNNWQIDGFPGNRIRQLKSLIDDCQEYGEKNEFSDWQFEELSTMKAVVKEVVGD